MVTFEEVKVLRQFVDASNPKNVVVREKDDIFDAPSDKVESWVKVKFVKPTAEPPTPAAKK